ncbi:MAG: F0F1 ATP synthase subunit delta [Desulfovibrio sp.]|nr:F0F1 ATP synthase subunit delta [Desulfovibrio sp.]
MRGSIAARRYARALFSLGREKGLSELEGYAAALDSVSAALGESPELRNLFGNPVISAAEKIAVIDKLAGKLKVSGAVLNFCRLMADKKRLPELPAAAAAFNALLDVEKGVARGEIYTATELDEAEKTKLVGELGKKTGRIPALEFRVDPLILGGVVLKIGDLVMDASLRAQLSILKDTIKKGELDHAD